MLDTKAQLKRPQLLLIDDEMASVALLMAFFKEQEIELLVALGGKDGLAKALRCHPDLILLDVRMPGMDGFTTCQKLKEDVHTCSIPVIFLSGSASLEDKLEGFRHGACDYITKPFHQEEVLARVSIWLRLPSAASGSAQDACLLPPFYRASELGRVSRDDVMFDRALNFIFMHLSEPMTLEGLCVALGVNRERITSIFRERVGLSVFEYSQEVRMERAKQYLRETGLQVQQIAMEVGYRNAGDFTRAFRSRVGVSPRDFRRQTGGKD